MSDPETDGLILFYGLLDQIISTSPVGPMVISYSRAFMGLLVGWNLLGG